MALPCYASSVSLNIEIIIVTLSDSELQGLSQGKHCLSCVVHGDCLIDIASKTNSSDLLMAKENHLFLPVLCSLCLPIPPPNNAGSKNGGIQLLTGNHIEMK